MTRYELFFLFQAGLSANDVHRDYGIPLSTAYRHQKHFRNARVLAKKLIQAKKPLSFNKRNCANNPDV